MKKVIYIHGQGGSPEEAARYAPLFPGYRVEGMDYTAENPRQAAEEFPKLWDSLSGDAETVLIANSIGAYFAMGSLGDKPISRAYFISPVTDMEKLILDMMAWAGVTEKELEAKGEIRTNFGQTLSWEYLCYVRSHPIAWHHPTAILTGEADTLSLPAVQAAFAKKIGATFTLMPGGEHWFHTPEQMAFLDHWLTERESR